MNGHGHYQQQQQYIVDRHHIPGRSGQNCALLDDDSYVGNSNSRGELLLLLRTSCPDSTPSGHCPGRMDTLVVVVATVAKIIVFPKLAYRTTFPEDTTNKGSKIMAVAKNHHMFSHQHEQQQHHFQPAMLPPSYACYHLQHQQLLLAAAAVEDHDINDDRRRRNTCWL